MVGQASRQREEPVRAGHARCRALRRDPGGRQDRPHRGNAAAVCRDSGRSSSSSRVLYLVHHGDAVGPDVNPMRPLSDRGRVEVDMLAQKAAERGSEARRHLAQRQAARAGRPPRPTGSAAIPSQHLLQRAGCSQPIPRVGSSMRSQATTGTSCSPDTFRTCRGCWGDCKPAWPMRCPRIFRSTVLLRWSRLRGDGWNGGGYGPRWQMANRKWQIALPSAICHLP